MSIVIRIFALNKNKQTMKFIKCLIWLVLLIVLYLAPMVAIVPIGKHLWQHAICVYVCFMCCMAFSDKVLTPFSKWFDSKLKQD